MHWRMEGWSLIGREFRGGIMAAQISNVTRNVIIRTLPCCPKTRPTRIRFRLPPRTYLHHSVHIPAPKARGYNSPHPPCPCSPQPFRESPGYTSISHSPNSSPIAVTPSPKRANPNNSSAEESQHGINGNHNYTVCSQIITINVFLKQVLMYIIEISVLFCQNPKKITLTLSKFFIFFLFCGTQKGTL